MDNSNIEVVEKEESGKIVRMLLVDGKEESATYIDEKKYELVSPYSMCICEYFKDYVAPEILLLGGGGFSIPKYFVSHYQFGRIDVIEQSPEIYSIAKVHFFVDKLISDFCALEDNRMNVFLEDAVEYLQKTDRGYDFIINDAYNGGEMDSNLLDEVNSKLIFDKLHCGGIYIINLFSALEGPKQQAWKDLKKILGQYFAQVSITQVDTSIPKNHRQNCVVVARK